MFYSKYHIVFCSSRLDIIVVNHFILFYSHVDLNLNATSSGIDMYERGPNIKLTHLPIEHAL